MILGYVTIILLKHTKLSHVLMPSCSLQKADKIIITVKTIYTIPGAGLKKRTGLEL